MTLLPHDPNSLNVELDQRLASGQTIPSSDPLVDAAMRLTAAPRPQLSAQAADRIRAAMLEAYQATPNPLGQLSSRLVPQSAGIRFALVASFLGVLLVVTVYAARNSIQFLALPPTVQIILTQTQTAIPTDTPTSTTQAVTETPNQEVIPSPSSAVITDVSPTEVPPQETPVPSVTPTVVPIVPTTLIETILPTLETTNDQRPARIIIEGPVREISDTSITIFDFVVVLSPEEPLRSQIGIGTVLRIEGNYVVEDQIVIAVYTSISISTPEIDVAVPALPINPTSHIEQPTGETWVDTGDCSNPPPSWAPANGWRRRCEGAATQSNASGNANSDNGNNNGTGNNSNGNSNGNGNSGNSNNGNGDNNGHGRSN